MCGKPDKGRTSPNSGRTLTGKALEAEGLGPHWPTPTVHGNTNAKGASPSSGDGLRTAAVKHWPTPQRADGERASEVQQRGNPTLVGAVKDWQTPAASMTAAGARPRSGSRSGELLLKGQVEAAELPGSARPTPAAQDAKNETLPPSQQDRDSIPGALMREEWAMACACGHQWRGTGPLNQPCPNCHQITSGTVTYGPPAPDNLNTTGKKRGSLNGRWVLQLMGYPSDWCDALTRQPSKPPATQLSRKSSK